MVKFKNIFKDVIYINTWVYTLFLILSTVSMYFAVGLDKRFFTLFIITGIVMFLNYVKSTAPPDVQASIMLDLHKDSFVLSFIVQLIIGVIGTIYFKNTLFLYWIMVAGIVSTLTIMYTPQIQRPYTFFVNQDYGEYKNILNLLETIMYIKDNDYQLYQKLNRFYFVDALIHSTKKLKSKDRHFFLDRFDKILGNSPKIMELLSNLQRKEYRRYLKSVEGIEDLNYTILALKNVFNKINSLLIKECKRTKNKKLYTTLSELNVQTRKVEILSNLY